MKNKFTIREIKAQKAACHAAENVMEFSSADNTIKDEYGFTARDIEMMKAAKEAAEMELENSLYD